MSDPLEQAIQTAAEQEIETAQSIIAEYSKHAMDQAAALTIAKEALEVVASDDPDQSWGAARQRARDALAQINQQESAK